MLCSLLSPLAAASGMDASMQRVQVLAEELILAVHDLSATKGSVENEMLNQVLDVVQPLAPQRKLRDMSEAAMARSRV
jgi:hypothetical protein